MLVLLAVLVPAAGADERTDLMVDALRRDPVFISSSLSRAVPAADVRALRQAVRAAPFPVFVVVAPTFSKQAGLESFDSLPDLLHDALDRDGLYIAIPGGSPSGIGAQAFGVRVRTAVRALPQDVYEDRRGTRPAEIAAYAVRLATTGRRDPRPVPSEQGRSRDADAGSPLGAIGVGAGVGGVAFIVTGWPWLAGRRRRSAPVAPARSTPINGALERERAQAGVLRLSGRLAKAGSPPPAAFDAYAAASKLVAEGRDPITFVAASTLVDTGEWVLAGSSARSCFFDPRHGEGKVSTRWRLGGEEVPLPVCAECAKDVARDRAPAALEDRGRPYFERDTLWARTGLGALEDGLAEQVLAGKWRR